MTAAAVQAQQATAAAATAAAVATRDALTIQTTTVALQMAIDGATSTADAAADQATTVAGAQQTAYAAEMAAVAIVQQDTAIRLDQERRAVETRLRWQPVLYGAVAAATMRGSEHNDPYMSTPHGIRTATNHSGGVQGGISNGEDIVFDVAFKPASTIRTPQRSVDREGAPVVLAPEGRHDPCVVPRAVPIVEAMACLVIADHLLRNATVHLARTRT